MDNRQSKVFRPGRIGSLQLRNRVIRSGCFEGMSQKGGVTENLIEHHRQVAAGGVGMTTVAYCSVTWDGRCYSHEMWMREEIMPDLKRLTDAVHKEGAAASIQLGHCGFFASRQVIGRTPVGASPKYCWFRMSRCREMNESEIDEMIEAFGRAADMARQAGFDAIEIHSGHGYLLSQFLSPWTNHRRDKYGGSLDNRLRFPAAVIRHIRDTLGPDFPILVKMNQQDGMKGGLEIEEAVDIAGRFESEGASALIPSCGFTAKTPLFMMRGQVPVMEMARNQSKLSMRLGVMLFGRLMVQRYPFEHMFLLDGARTIKDAVNIPVIYIGGVTSIDDINTAMDEGFGFVQAGRATIRDPQFVRKLERGEIRESDCDHCNRCIAAMDGGGVYCVTARRSNDNSIRA